MRHGAHAMVLRPQRPIRTPRRRSILGDVTRTRTRLLAHRTGSPPTRLLRQPDESAPKENRAMENVLKSSACQISAAARSSVREEWPR